MNLVLRAHSLNDQPLSEPLSSSFGAGGGTIGRSEANTLTLPDPERHISRLQAEVIAADGGYTIRNAGGANAIYLNDRALAPGERGRLSHRDELQIGGYLLRVLLEDDRATERTVTGAHVAVDARSVSSGEPRTDSHRIAASANPFADLVGPASSGAPVRDPFQFLQAVPSAEAAPARLPDDFDPFANLDAPAQVVASSTPQDLLAAVGAGSGAVVGIDEAFGLQPQPRAGQADPLAGFLAGPASTDAAVDTDPLAMFADTPAPRPAQAGAFDHTPELNGAYTPPRVVDDTAAAPPARHAEPAARSDDALWSAFCEGAAIRAGNAPALGPQQMRLLGQLMREAVDGTLRLMTVRATAKHELRAAVTTIRGRNNNPLKFSPDAQLAMEQLVQPPLRGFMSAPAAMQDAMHDLVGHSIGTMAGMRAALAGVLQRFEPQQLEAKLAERSMLDNLLAMNRKAKLWDLYLQHFDAIRNEAQDDFDTLFGKAFVAAYEEQLDRLPRRDEAA